MKKLLLATTIAAIPVMSVAEQTEYRLGGIHIGEDCSTLNTTQTQSSVTNPDDWQDKIEITRTKLEKEITEDISVYAYCSVIDNTVYHIVLVSTDVTTGTKIQDKFKETQGRKADDEDSFQSKGMTVGRKWYPQSLSTSSGWKLENNMDAYMSTYTNIEKLLGKDLGKLRGLETVEGTDKNKWRVSYRVTDHNEKEWNFLKNGGAVTSSEKEDKLIDDLF